jgi:hypothetical protein
MTCASTKKKMAANLELDYLISWQQLQASTLFFLLFKTHPPAH